MSKGSILGSLFTGGGGKKKTQVIVPQETTITEEAKKPPRRAGGLQAQTRTSGMRQMMEQAQQLKTTLGG